MMELANYVKIGRAQLLCLLGLQENYTREIKMLDVEASGCINCPYHPINQFISSGTIESESKCHLCSHTVFKNKIVYVNEKNQFARSKEPGAGYIPEAQIRLKSGAILLYMVIHFCNINTATGAAYNINVDDLAELLKCNKKTIYNNLNLLTTYGYIHYIPVDRDSVTVVIQNYNSIFSKAEQGGRGYYLITADLLKQILPLKKINELRLCLRFIDATLQEERSGNRHPRVRMNYEDVARWFPAYVKPYIIKHNLDSLSPIFSDIRCGRHEVAVTLSPDYNAAKQMTIASHESYTNISEYIAQMQAAIKEFNSFKDPSNQNLKELGIRLPSYQINEEFKIEYSTLQNIYLNHSERQNLAHLALEYSDDEVLHALQILYNEYIQPQVVIKSSIGALIRTIIEDEKNYYHNLTPISKLA